MLLTVYTHHLQARKHNGHPQLISFHALLIYLDN
jgi:hypothetical protein